jgi:hypothetical protein
MYKPGLPLLYDIVHFYNNDHDDEIRCINSIMFLKLASRLIYSYVHIAAFLCLSQARSVCIFVFCV